MKRSWMGLGLLILLLATALVVTAVMDRIHEEMLLSLAQSSESALLGDWEDVGFFLDRAEREWERFSHLRACFSDQSFLEEVESTLAALDIYRQSREAISYRASCAALMRNIEALGEAHRPVWWNVL